MAFLLGILALQQLTALPSWPWLAGLLFLLLFFLTLSGRYFSISLLAAACFGILWAGYHGLWTLKYDLDPALEGEELLLSGVIASLPQREMRSIRFVFLPD